MSDEKNYKKREIDEKFTDIQNSLIRIENQTTKTNGHVADLKSWQNFIKGGLAVLSIIVVPIFLYVIYTLIKLK